MSETPEMKDRTTAGAFNVTVSGSNNVLPMMHETLGVIFLGIISLVLLFELRRVYDQNLKLKNKCCDCCNQGCDCCKEGCECCKKGCDCCKEGCECCKKGCDCGNKGCDCGKTE